MSERAVLVLADTTYRYIGTVRAHMDALRLVPAEVLDYRAARHVDFDRWDAVIVHYSVVLADLEPALAVKLRSSSALKMAFIQDEYRWVDRTARAVRKAGVSVVFTCVDHENMRLVYRQASMMTVRLVPTLTGYADPKLGEYRGRPFEERLIHLGYRARKLPAWYGRHAEQKWRIAEVLADRLTRDGRMTIDISTSECDRLYGGAWLRFLGSCRSTIITESGASVVDHDDRIRAGHVSHEPVDGIATIRAISPRVFEAAALRTLMLIVPGYYDGVLVPGWHGPILQPDLSNLREIVDILHDPAAAEAYTTRAYWELARGSAYQPTTLAADVRRVIRSECQRAASIPTLVVARVFGAPAIAAAHFRRRGAMLASRLSPRLPVFVRDALRPVAVRLLRVP